MLRVGFEPPIPVFERLKTVRVSERSATGIGYIYINISKGKVVPVLN
jgi:hypothetical protein